MTNPVNDPARTEILDKYMAQAIRANQMGCDRLIKVSLGSMTTADIEKAALDLSNSLDRIVKLMGHF